MNVLSQGRTISSSVVSGGDLFWINPETKEQYSAGPSQMGRFVMSYAVFEELLQSAPELRRPNRTQPSDDALYQRITDLTPSNDVLKSLADKYPAPQVWYDESD